MLHARDTTRLQRAQPQSQSNVSNRDWMHLETWYKNAREQGMPRGAFSNGTQQALSGSVMALCPRHRLHPVLCWLFFWLLHLHFKFEHLGSSLELEKCGHVFVRLVPVLCRAGQPFCLQCGSTKLRTSRFWATNCKQSGTPQLVWCTRPSWHDSGWEGRACGVVVPLAVI